MPLPSWRATAVAAAALTCLGAYRASKAILGPSLPRSLAMFQRWSRRTCALLRLNVRVIGQPPAGHCVYVANHRSYLDIPVLSSVLAATFLSNHDVAGWPIIGAAASELGVVFVDRDEMRARVRAARQIMRRLGDASMVVFPEGTTGGELLPAAFQGGLFRLLHRFGRPAVPVTLRYSTREVYWIEDLSLGEHLRRRVLANGPLSVDVHVGSAVSPIGMADGDVFASSVYDAVCAPLLANGELTSA